MLSDSAANQARFLRNIFARCVADLICQILYPNPESIFYDLFNQLNRTPIKLAMSNPTTGLPFTFDLDGVELIATVRSTPPRQIPALIYDLRDGDYTAVLDARKTAIENFTRFGAPPGRAMAYSIFCSQGMYAFTPRQLEMTARYPEAVWANDYIYHSLLPLPCDQWPSRPRDSRPVVSDIPTLVLNGQDDPDISPDYARLFAQDLRRGVIVTVPRTGHGVLSGGGPCPNTMARTFLNNPTSPPSADCLANEGRPVFDTAFVIRSAAAGKPTRIAVFLLGTALGLMVVKSLVFTPRAANRTPTAWRLNLKLVGWRSTAVSASIICLAWAADHFSLISIDPARLVAAVIPLVAAIQAASLLSPEDDPAFDLLLATPRPLVRTLWERLAALYVWLGGLALLISLLLAISGGEAVILSLGRWLPPLVCLTALAVWISLITRRAALGILFVCLLWIGAIIFGDFVVIRWPFSWPLHLYLEAVHPEFGLNRLFLILLGVTLIASTAFYLNGNDERLLLGNRKSRWPQKTIGKSARAGLGTRSGQRMRQSNIFIAAGWTRLVYQLGAMIRYEFILQWRRAALPSLLMGLAITPVLGAFLARDKFSGYLTVGALTPESAQAHITAEIMLITWIGLCLILIVMLPIMVAETIPNDRQLAVHELLDSLPLSPGVYLMGKLLGLWFSLFVIFSTAMLIAGGVWWLVVGPFNMVIYLELWLVGAVALAFINAGLSMLLAAGQPTNRRARLIGGAFSLFCLAGIGLAFSTFGTFWDLLNPARPVPLLYYFIGWPGAIHGSEMLGQLNRDAFAQIQLLVNWNRVVQNARYGGDTGLSGLDTGLAMAEEAVTVD